MITVVIPTLNAEATLGPTLAALVPAAVDGLIREVIVIDGGSTDRTSDIVKNVFTEKYPQSQITVDDNHGGALSELMVVIKVVDSGKGKCVTLTAKQNGRNFPTADACVKDALWASDLDQYRMKYPKGEWIVGWSGTAETDVETARQQAREDAARQLLPFVAAKFPELNVPYVDPNSLRRSLERELTHHRVLNEEFVQHLRTPVTGQGVCRVGLLVDASSTGSTTMFAAVSCS